MKRWIGLLLIPSLVQADATLVRRTRTEAAGVRGALEVRDVLMLKGPDARQEASPTARGLWLKQLDTLDDGVFLIPGAGPLKKVDRLNQAYQEIPWDKVPDFLEWHAADVVAPFGAYRIGTVQSKTLPGSETRLIRRVRCRKTLLEFQVPVDYPDWQMHSTVRLAVTLWTPAPSKDWARLSKAESGFQSAFLKKSGASWDPDDLRRVGLFHAARRSAIRSADLARALAPAVQSIREQTATPLSWRAEWYQAFFRDGKKVQANSEIPLEKPFVTVAQDVESFSLKPLPAQRFKVPAGFNSLPDYSGHRVED